MIAAARCSNQQLFRGPDGTSDCQLESAKSAADVSFGFRNINAAGRRPSGIGTSAP
jgi:hypothetical protein